MTHPPPIRGVFFDDEVVPPSPPRLSPVSEPGSTASDQADKPKPDEPDRGDDGPNRRLQMLEGPPPCQPFGPAAPPTSPPSPAALHAALFFSPKPVTFPRTTGHARSAVRLMTTITMTTKRMMSRDDSGETPMSDQGPRPSPSPFRRRPRSVPVAGGLFRGEQEPHRTPKPDDYGIYERSRRPRATSDY